MACGGGEWRWRCGLRALLAMLLWLVSISRLIYCTEASSSSCCSFRCRGGVVLRGLVLDQTGFREALLVEGRGGPVTPLIEGCTIKCSGDDAVNVAGAGGGRCGAPVHSRVCACMCAASGGHASRSEALPLLLPSSHPPGPCAAAPTLLRCTINAKKCGVRALRASAPRLERCVLEQCGEQGVHASDSAAPHLHR